MPTLQEAYLWPFDGTVASLDASFSRWTLELMVSCPMVLIKVVVGLLLCLRSHHPSPSPSSFMWTGVCLHVGAKTLPHS